MRCIWLASEPNRTKEKLNCSPEGRLLLIGVIDYVSTWLAHYGSPNVHSWFLQSVFWRAVCWAKYSHTLLAPNAFLGDSVINLIASQMNVNNWTILSNPHVKTLVFWQHYGDKLLTRIQAHLLSTSEPIETPQPCTWTVPAVQMAAGCPQTPKG